MSVQTVIAAILPALAYVLFVWRVRRHDRAILFALVGAVAWGAVVATSMTMLAHESLRASMAAIRAGGGANLNVIVLSPMLEEALKGVVLLLMLRAARLETALEGALLGAAVGLGFAATENLFSFTLAQAQSGMWGWLGAVITRTSLTSVMHACSTAAAGTVAGHWAGRSLFDRWVFGPLLGFVAAVLVHTGFNGGVLAGGQIATGIHLAVTFTLALVLAVVVRWALASERQLLAKELLRESAEHDTLSREEAHRLEHGVRLPGIGDLASRLALLRVREARCPSGKGSRRRREIITLRGVLASRSSLS